MMINKHKKRCSTSLAIKETQLKTTMNYYYTSIRIMTTPKADKDVEKLDFSYIAVGSIKWYSYFGKQFSFLKN